MYGLYGFFFEDCTDFTVFLNERIVRIFFKTYVLYGFVLKIYGFFQQSFGHPGYHRFHIGCIFAEYDLSKPTTQNCIYMNFRIILSQFLYQFLKTGTPEILRFHSIPSLIFPLQSL